MRYSLCRRADDGVIDAYTQLTNAIRPDAARGTRDIHDDDDDDDDDEKTRLDVWRIQKSCADEL
jgi:hypothetical protein